ncbi:U11/U12 small nuclear ribonucleoprotein 25 kDa protein-like [Tubulanus polymorphus]|uniref:U11/U12 small nuclear ribonucleoprotein 25 kDa protein-like n=1 Tax=Tubulanus polymorphus TaxID=672921 RepID=UPI003DA5A917
MEMEVAPPPLSEDNAAPLPPVEDEDAPPPPADEDAPPPPADEDAPPPPVPPEEPSVTAPALPPDTDLVNPTVPHVEAMIRFSEGLAAIIQEDPLLCDLPSQLTLEELKSKVALEYGQAMTVNVRRADDIVMPVVIAINGTVRDLKNAIKLYFNLKQERESEIRRPKHISWRYIWRTYYLYYEGTKLENDRKKLKDYGIKNRDEVTFIKRLTAKN